MLLKNNIFFREHVFFEDTDWLLIALYNAQTIGTFNFSYYGYRENPGSTTRKDEFSILKNNVEAIVAIPQYFGSKTISATIQYVLLYRMKQSILSYLRLLGKFPLKKSYDLLVWMESKGLLNYQYRCSFSEQFLLGMMKYTPLCLCMFLKFLVLCKRVLMALVKRR